MNQKVKGFASLLTAMTAVLSALALITTSNVHASGKTGGGVDTTPSSGGGGTKSGGGSGGGGGGTTTTPISSATLTFSAISSGSCTGNYQILPYYPTLLDLLVNVSVSGLNVPDGTVVYVNAIATGGTGIYPYITTPMTVVGGSCSSSQHYFIYPNVGVAGVTISDTSGNILFAGN